MGVEHLMRSSLFALVFCLVSPVHAADAVIPPSGNLCSIKLGGRGDEAADRPIYMRDITLQVLQQTHCKAGDIIDVLLESKYNSNLREFFTLVCDFHQQILIERIPRPMSGGDRTGALLTCVYVGNVRSIAPSPSVRP